MKIGIFGVVCSQTSQKVVLTIAFPVVLVDGVYYKAQWHRNRWIATDECPHTVVDYVETVKRLPKVEL